MPNIESFQTWLSASLYITDYRPVLLTEYMKVGDVLFDKSITAVRSVKSHHPTKDPDAVRNHLSHSSHTGLDF